MLNSDFLRCPTLETLNLVILQRHLAFCLHWTETKYRWGCRQVNRWLW